MKVPKPLKKGDTIALISVSGSVSEEELRLAVRSVERLGFRVYEGKTTRARYGYFAGPDEMRAEELMNLFANPEIDGIICIRGGYGAYRILPFLDFDLLKANAKVFAGYSDVTALHIAFNQICKMVTYHTPMPATEFIHKEMDAYTWKSFMTAVTNDESYLLKNPISKPIRAFVGGKERGTLIGGNLSLIISSLVTPYEIDTENKILFLEDIDENPLRIDRMLTQLKLAKKFEHVRGILLGSWKNCEGNIKGTTLQSVFEEKFSTFHVPVLMDLACGHSLPTMSLPLGKTIEIDADEKIIKVL